MKNFISFGLLFLGISSAYGQFGFNLGRSLTLPFGLGKTDASASGSSSGSASSSASVSVNTDPLSKAVQDAQQGVAKQNQQGTGNSINESLAPLAKALSIPQNVLAGYMNQIPDLKGLFGSNIPNPLGDILNQLNGSMNNAGGLPGIPNLNNLPGVPNLGNLPKAPNLNNLPGVPNLNNLPGIPSLNNLPGVPNLNNLPRVPNLNSLPGVPSIGGLPDFSSLKNLPGLSKLNIPSLPQIPSFPELLKALGIPNMDDLIQFVRAIRLPNMPTIGEIYDALQNPNLKDAFNVPDLSALLNGTTSGDIQNAMNGLENTVSNSANVAKGKVDNAVSQMQNFANQAQDSIENVVNTATKSVQDVIGGQSQAVQDCVSKKGSPVDAIMNSAKDTIINCIMKQVNKAKALGEKVKNEIGAAASNVAEIRNGLANCSIDAQISMVQLLNISGPQASCFTSSLLKIQTETLMLPINLAQDAATAVAQVNGLKGAAIQCQANLMGEVSKATLASSATLVKCMVNPN